MFTSAFTPWLSFGLDLRSNWPKVKEEMSTENAFLRAKSTGSNWGRTETIQFKEPRGVLCRNALVFCIFEKIEWSVEVDNVLSR